MAMTLPHILQLLALLFAVFGAVPLPPTIPNNLALVVAVILLAVAGLIT